MASEWEHRKQLERDLYEKAVGHPLKKSESVDECLGSDMPSSPESFEKECDTIFPSESSEKEVQPHRYPDPSGIEHVTGQMSETVSSPASSFDFSQLCKANLELPKGWIQGLSKNEDCLSLFITKVAEPDHGRLLPTVVLKNIILNSELEPQLYILNQRLEQSTVDSMHCGRINKIEQLNELIKALDHFSVCSGPRLQKELDDGICSVAHKRVDGVWRHNKCSLLVDASSDNKVCMPCRRIKRLVNQNLRRVATPGRDSTRIRVIVSPKTKKRLSKLREKHHTTKKAHKRASTKLSQLEKELERCRTTLQRCEELDIQKHIERGAISENTGISLQEILNAAKRKSAKGRRYSEEWILLCMLLHMRSPTGYKFIHDHGILPVPNVRTLRKYLSSIKVSCGFDANFFAVLETTFSKMEEKHKHGILLIDEIGTRESVAVNSQTLTYTGLIDFGEDGPTATTFKDRANHGLVIMYQSISTKHTQPIAVFASRGPVGGSVLAKLIVKATVLVEKAGAKVHGVVTDGASTNRKFWAEVGVSGKLESLNNSFEHPLDAKRRMWVFSDTPHFIKTVRTRLHNEGVLQVCHIDYFYYFYIVLMYIIQLSDGSRGGAH